MLDLLPYATATNLTIFAFAALSAFILNLTLKTRSHRLPPGPPGEPIIGNLRALATKPPHLYYTELKKIYGDVIHVSALGQPFILLGSYEAANQLLSKRGAIYSSRPPAIFNNEYLGLDLILPVTPYGPIFKEERRIFQAHLGKEDCRTLYRADVETEARKYVLRSLQRGNNTDADYFVALQKTFLQSIYGYKVTSDDDPVLQTAIRGTVIASASLVPGRYLVNHFPLLRYVPSWFPGTGWKQEAKVGEEIISRLVYGNFRMVQQAEAEGVAKASFMRSALRDKTTLTNSELAKTIGASFVAGAETTAAFIQYFIYAMLMYPEFQKKAQEEIDRVIGRDRLPDLDDYANLPYLEAIIKEISRWRPTAPIAVPHLVTKDDVYRDYLIPKGAIVFHNLWAIGRDENVYSNPDEFNPDRFMVPNPPMDPRLFSFGVGRRVCPGIQYAEVVYFSALATILATVDIVKAQDASGNEIYVQPGAPGEGKLINAPLPFAYHFRPRSETAVNLLSLAVEA